ncbi:hypothetical protein JTE90_028058 [Oedothorax gibbosus]|nr:hypothetical protein JTE90_028058 [Oedothorax gibbosus]
MNIGSESKINFSHIKCTSKCPRRLANRRVVRTVSVKDNLRDPDILKTGKTSKPYNLLKFGNIPITDLSHELLLSEPSDIDGNSSSFVKQQHNRSEVKYVYDTENDLKTFFLLKTLNDHKPNILSKIGNVSEPAMEPELLLKYGNSSEPDFFLISGNSSEPNHPSKSGNNSKIDLLLQYENSGEPDFLSIYRSSSDTDFLLTSGNSSEPNLYERFGQPDFLLILGNSSKSDHPSKSSNSSEIDLLLQYKNSNKSDFLLTFENSSESDHLPKSDISSEHDYLSEVWKSSKPQLPLEDGNNSEPEFLLTTGNINETNLLLKSRNPNEPIIFINSLIGEPYQYSEEVYKSGKQQTNKRVERTTDIISTESRLLKYLLSRLTQNNGQGNSSSLETRLINSLLLGNNRGIGQTVHATGNGSVPVLLWKLMSNVLNQHLERDNHSTGSNGQTGIGLGLLGSNLFGHLLGEHNSAFGNLNPLGQNQTNIGLSGILTPYTNSISKIVSQNGGGTLKGLELLRNSTLVQQLLGQSHPG